MAYFSRRKKKICNYLVNYISTTSTVINLIMQISLQFKKNASFWLIKGKNEKKIIQFLRECPLLEQTIII